MGAGWREAHKSTPRLGGNTRRGADPLISDRAIAPNPAGGGAAWEAASDAHAVIWGRTGPNPLGSYAQGGWCLGRP